MVDQTLKRLQDLVQTDPVAAPLAALQSEALSAAGDPAWEQMVPSFQPGRLAQRVPLLDEQTLRLPPDQLARLVARLVGSIAQGGQREQGLQRLCESSPRQLSLLQASLEQDPAAIEGLASELELQPGELAVLGQLATLPLLQACGRAAAPLLAGVRWEAGYCPVCAAWPALAELRGLERQRWLRCGRCGSGWSFPHQRCAFCDNADHRSLGYLAPEDQRDSRRAETCDRCRGYLKTFTTFGPTPPPDLLIQDLGSLELDAAALEREYNRPDQVGFNLHLTLLFQPHSNGGTV